MEAYLISLYISDEGSSNLGISGKFPTLYYYGIFVSYSVDLKFFPNFKNLFNFFQFIYNIFSFDTDISFY